MKLIASLIFLITITAGCEFMDSENSRVSPMSAEKITGIEITDRRVVLTAVYTTPTPCWHYYKNEISNDDSVFTSKVFGRDISEVCIQVIASFDHKDTISFYTNGIKTIKLWQNDSTYLDTTITLE